MKIYPRTKSRILKGDLHLSVYKRTTGHLLTEKFKIIQHDRAKQLLQTFKNNSPCKILLLAIKLSYYNFYMGLN